MCIHIIRGIRDANVLDNPKFCWAQILKPLSHCHEFSYDIRRVGKSPHVDEMWKGCRHMSSEFEYMISYFAFCPKVSTRILNCDLFKNSRRPRSSRGNPATLPYIVKQCPIHCRILSRIRFVPEQQPSHGDIMRHRAGNVRLITKTRPFKYI